MKTVARIAAISAYCTALAALLVVHACALEMDARGNESAANSAHAA